MARRYYSLAALLALLGIAGFVVPGPWLGVLTVTSVDSVVHLASAACAAFAASRGLGAMRTCGKVLGIAFAALAVAGFVTEANATAWLHVIVALLFLYNALLAPPIP